jgi:purine-binding chemotaxis protein CheW
MNEYKATELEIYERELSIENKFLILKLGNQNFAINVSSVSEVLDSSQDITIIPSGPEYLLGVINIRGIAIPVIDLRIRFGLDVDIFDEETRIVILEYYEKDQLCKIGGITNSVEDVIYIDKEQITEAPKIAVKWNENFIKGIVRMNEEFIIILDLDKVLSCDNKVFKGVKSENRKFQ